MVKIVRLLVLLASVTATTVQEVANQDTAFTSAERRIKGYQMRLQEQQQHYQELQRDLNNFDKESYTDMAEVVEVLESISRRSIEDMQLLAGLLKQQGLETERRHQEAAERLKYEQTLLRQRWWQAKKTLKKTKREAEARAQASLLQAEVLAAETLASLRDVEHLRGLQQKVDMITLRVQAHKQASGWRGFWVRWWKRMAWFVTSANSVLWHKAPRHETDETHSAQDALEETGHKRSVGLVNVAEQTSLHDDPVTAKGESGEVMMVDGRVIAEDHADEVMLVDCFVTVEGEDEDFSKADGSATFKREAKEEPAKIGDADAMSGKSADSEAPTPPHDTPENIAESSAILPEGQERRRYRCLLALFAVFSCVFLAFRLYVRVRRWRGGRIRSH